MSNKVNIKVTIYIYNKMSHNWKCDFVKTACLEKIKL